MTEESLVHRAVDYDSSTEMQEWASLPREEATCPWDVLFTVTSPVPGIRGTSLKVLQLCSPSSILSVNRAAVGSPWTIRQLSRAPCMPVCTLVQFSGLETACPGIPDSPISP